MPATVQSMIAETAETAVARGIRQGLEETVGGFFRPGIPEGIGFAVGLTILGIGLSVRARRRHLERIEEKLDELVEIDPEEVAAGLAAAREGRRDRRGARRSDRATTQA